LVFMHLKLVGSKVEFRILTNFFLYF
jgi:hypothetical protein